MNYVKVYTKTYRDEERLKWMALINKSERSFLGHLNDIYDISETAKTVRNVIMNL